MSYPENPPPPPIADDVGDPPWRVDTLADSVMILLAMAALQRVAGFLRAILFCRWLEPEQLGQWDMAFSFLLLSAPLAVMALPGAFGRYVEHYRQRGQLRTFLRRTTLTCTLLVLVGAGVVGLFRRWFSELIFGTPEETTTVLLLAGSLVAVVAYNFSIELFTALRNIRLVSVLQLMNSLAFALIGLGLILGWKAEAASVIIGYGGACLITALVAGWRLRGVWHSTVPPAAPVGRKPFWAKLAPFAGWLLVVNLLANLFEVIDRYMIVHYSGAAANAALAEVGNYHSSRVIPMLLVTVAAMLGSMITPHLSHDWEAGNKKLVGRRLALFLKLFGFALCVGTTAVLVVSPLLFGWAFKGKFDGGLAVLPWTLTYCTWFAMLLILQNYLWCAEKAYLSSVALGVGLAVNIVLNLVLLPPLGLLGAVLATTTANLVALALICLFIGRLGFRFDVGTRVVLGLAPVVCLGPWLALAVLAVVAAEALWGNHLLTADERRQIAEQAEQYLDRLPWRRSARVPVHPA